MCFDKIILCDIKESVAKANESLKAMNKTIPKFATGGVVSNDVFSNFVTHDCGCSVDTLALNKVFENANNIVERGLNWKGVNTMTKSELMESHTFEELAEMNVNQRKTIIDLRDKLNNTQGVVCNPHTRELMHNGIVYIQKEKYDSALQNIEKFRKEAEKLSIENKEIRDQLNEKEKKLQSIKTSDSADSLIYSYQSTHLFMMQSKIERIQKENTNLNATIDVLLEKLKGK